jgi:hypothetical protein
MGDRNRGREERGGQHVVAVVKANYVKRGGGAKARAKATIRYIQHRRGKDGERITRQLFGSDGPMERQEAYRMIDEAGKGSLFYRLVVSPDPKREDHPKDLDMRELTERTIRTLEERAGEPILWVGALHADHAPHRHVHVLALVPGKLNVADLQALTGAATEAAQFQRQNLDLAQGIGIQAAIRRQAGDRAHQLFQSYPEPHQLVGPADESTAYGGGPSLTEPLCKDCLEPLTKRHKCEAKRWEKGLSL